MLFFVLQKFEKLYKHISKKNFQKKLVHVMALYFQQERGCEISPKQTF